MQICRTRRGQSFGNSGICPEGAEHVALLRALGILPVETGGKGAGITDLSTSPLQH